MTLPAAFDPAGGLHYSLAEQATGRRWLDGKQIYQKTVSIGALPNNTSKAVAHGISGLDDIVLIYGISIGTTLSQPLSKASPTDANNIQLSADGTNVTVVTGKDESGTVGYVTLQYTKS